MKCTQTGRCVVFRTSAPSTDDVVYHGDQYTCPACSSSFVVCNSKPNAWPGAFAQLKDQAMDQQAHNFPIDVPRIEEPVAIPPSVPNRDINSLSETQLEQMIWGSSSERPTTVRLQDKFTETELVQLIAHPQFKSFNPKFQELIWQAVSVIFSRDLKKEG